MVELLKQKALEQKIKIAIVPVSCILDVKADIEKLIEEGTLTRRMKWIEEKRYEFQNSKFQPKSIVVAVRALNIAKAAFNYNDTKKSYIVEDIYHPSIRMHNLLSELFCSFGMSLEYISWIPHKNIAVRSGLCEYGRNNITYSDDWGSFIRIETYITDAPYADYTWRNVVSMSLCNKCRRCINNCPTKAILPDRFLIDSSRCLACLKYDDTDMPDWVPKPAPDRFVECLSCQNVCPKNRERLLAIENIEFDVNETETMLNSKGYRDFPDNIKRKLWYYNNGEDYKCIPRNLKSFFN